jgi:hypothetical protein
MISTRPAKRLVTAIAAISAAIAIVPLIAPFANTERLLASGLASAFSDTQPSATGTTRQRTTASPAFDPEALRLSAWHDADVLDGGVAVKIGDRITIGRDGQQPRVFEVVATRPLDAEVTRVEGAAGPRLVLVTGQAIGEPGRLLRFLVETTGDATPAPAPTATAARAL